MTSRPRSLRGRVAALATAAFALVLLLVGAAAVASFADGERDRVDQSLESRPLGAVGRAIGAPGPGRPGPPRGPRPGRPPPGDRDLGPRALRPEGEYIRLISDGRVIRSVDTPDGLPVPDGPGIRTLSAAGEEHRSLTREVEDGLLLEIGTALGPSSERVSSLRNRLLALGVGGVVVVALLAWWLAGVALRPLVALRGAAGRVSTTRDLATRLDPEGPDEVAALAGSVNEMLARLERSASETDDALAATRRFAADAGHELRTPMTALRAHIGALRRNPDLAGAERMEMLAAAEHDAGRAVRLLELLQTLARGDAGAALPRGQVQLSSLVETAVEAARARHPGTSFELEAPAGEIVVTGWEDGLRALADNLLENAARHGRPEGAVHATLSLHDGEATLTVDDDGAGIPAADRERVFERFAHGDASRGSGLGLALVRQQARLHGGDARAEAAPAGGARVRVTLALTQPPPPA